MTGRIVPANLRDLAYVAAHMRDEDRAEVECQLDRWSAAEIAAMSLRDYAFVVELNDNPEAAFGAGQVRKGLWIAWSWGTPKIRRCLPIMLEFITGTLQPRLYADGAVRVEARALRDNVLAHQFLLRIGGTIRCLLPSYGKNGETFILFDWTRASWEKSHVFLRGSDNPDPAASTKGAAA